MKVEGKRKGDRHEVSLGKQNIENEMRTEWRNSENEKGRWENRTMGTVRTRTRGTGKRIKCARVRPGRELAQAVAEGAAVSQGTASVDRLETVRTISASTRN